MRGLDLLRGSDWPQVLVGLAVGLAATVGMIVLFRPAADSAYQPSERVAIEPGEELPTSSGMVAGATSLPSESPLPSSEPAASAPVAPASGETTLIDADPTTPGVQLAPG